MIGQRLLHYHITEKLGEGGMGAVYEARETHLNRFAAIEVLPGGEIRRREAQGAVRAESKGHGRCSGTS